MNPINRVARILLAGMLFAAATGFVPDRADARADEYVPFVTDFPRASEPYVPFVSDFPRPAPTPSAAPRPDASGIDWAGLTVEGGVGASIAALLAGAALVLARRRNGGPRLTDC
jgi:hypothetical protein